MILILQSRRKKQREMICLSKVKMNKYGQVTEETEWWEYILYVCIVIFIVAMFVMGLIATFCPVCLGV